MAVTENELNNPANSSLGRYLITCFLDKIKSDIQSRKISDVQISILQSAFVQYTNASASEMQPNADINLLFIGQYVTELWNLAKLAND